MNQHELARWIQFLNTFEIAARVCVYICMRMQRVGVLVMCWLPWLPIGPVYSIWIFKIVCPDYRQGPMNCPRNERMLTHSIAQAVSANISVYIFVKHKLSFFIIFASLRTIENRIVRTYTRADLGRPQSMGSVTTVRNFFDGWRWNTAIHVFGTLELRRSLQT